MDIPLTPLEQGGDYATAEEETAFLAEVAKSPRIRITTLGPASAHDLVVRKATIRHAGPYAPTVMIVGGQHGTEPAGRQAALEWLRNLAYSDDPLYETMRARANFVIIPTVNPAGAYTGLRSVPRTGVADLNREHLSLATVENRYVQETITTHRPVLIVDCHEHQFGDSLDVMTKSSDHMQGDRDLVALGAQLHTTVRQAVIDTGDDYSNYPQSTRPGVLSNTSVLRHAIGFLIETSRNLTPVRRAEQYGMMERTILEWLTTNLDAVAATAAQARRRKTLEGAHQTAPFDLITETLDPPPAGYIGLRRLPSQLATLGVTGTRGLVPMGQEAQPIIPYLLDPDYEAPVTEATRYLGDGDLPGPYPVGGIPDRIKILRDGITVDVEAVRLGTPKGTINVWSRPGA